jgi:hypothetical protein
MYDEDIEHKNGKIITDEYVKSSAVIWEPGGSQVDNERSNVL